MKSFNDMFSRIVTHSAALVLFFSAAGSESNAQSRQKMALPTEAETAKHAREWAAAKARNDTTAHTTLHEPPFAEKMREVESLLQRYVDMLKPMPGFSQRTLQALYERGGRLFEQETAYRKSTRQSTLQGLEKLLNTIAFNLQSALDNAAAGQTFLEDVLEGWSYRFVTPPDSFRDSIRLREPGRVCHEDDAHLVYAHIRVNYDVNDETAISFYDPRTLDLQITAIMPNTLEQFGKIRDTNIFFALLRGDGDAPDASNVLVLIDPLARQMERLVLIKTEYKRGGEAAVICGARELKVLVGDAHFKACPKSCPLNPAFAAVSLLYRQAEDGFTGQSVSSSDAEAQFSDRFVRLDRTALSSRTLSFLGRNEDYPPLRPWTGRARNSPPEGVRRSETFVRSLIPAEAGFAHFHVVRTLHGGLLQDIRLGDLSEKTLKVGTSTLSNPGIFDSGAVCGVEAGSLVIANEKGVRKFSKPKAIFSFDGRHAYAIAQKHTETDPAGANAHYDAIDAEGREQRIDFSPLLRRIPSASSFRAIPPHGILVQSRIPGDNNPDRFRLLSVPDGRLVAGPFFGDSYMFNDCEMLPGISRDGIRLYAIVDNIAATSGQHSYSVHLLDEKNQASVRIFSPERMPAHLDFRRREDGTIRFLVVEEGRATIMDYHADRGAAKKVKEWITSPQNAPTALYEAASSVLCVPADFGFEVYRIFTDDAARKAFDLHLSSEGGYAVELPNGVFAGSPGCESLIRSRVSDGYFSSAVVAPWRNRPAEVLHALGGTPETIQVLDEVTRRWMVKMGNPQQEAEPTVRDLPGVSLLQAVPLWAGSDYLTLRMRVRAGAAGLKNLIVRVNGVEQRGELGGGLEGDQERAVRLAEGQNWVEIVALDTLGRSSDALRFRTIFNRGQASPRRYIVAMGVSRYREQGLNLEFAAKDAQEVCAALQAAHPGKSEVLLLTDDAVNYDALSKVGQFLRGAGESDEVIWFCAGHGFLDKQFEYRFAGHDFQVEDMDAGGFSLNEIVATLGESRSLRRLILLDTCHAGLMGERDEAILSRGEPGTLLAGVRAIQTRGMAPRNKPLVSGLQQARYVEEMFRLPGALRGVNVIGASGGAQYALESGEWKNGVFTASLIEGIRDRKADSNHDGAVNLGEIREYLARRVTELTGGAQKPSVVALEVDQDIVLRAPDLRDGDSRGFRDARIEVPPPQGSGAAETPQTLESLVREYHRAIELRDEKGVAACLGSRVDYYAAGNVMRGKVLADVRGDWNRYKQARFEVSDFQEKSPTEANYFLEYTLMEGERPRRGKLLMTVRAAGEPGQMGILSIKAKVISAK